MKCSRCDCEDVIVQTSAYTKSQSRSFLWNLLMVTCTCGFWLLWMLIRKRKEKTVKDTIATCQKCGHYWKV